MSRNFVSKIMAGAIALTPVSCMKKEPLHQITNRNIHPIIERVDSFAKSDALIYLFFLSPLYPPKF